MNRQGKASIIFQITDTMVGKVIPKYRPKTKRAVFSQLENSYDAFDGFFEIYGFKTITYQIEKNQRQKISAARPSNMSWSTPPFKYYKEGRRKQTTKEFVYDIHSFSLNFSFLDTRFPISLHCSDTRYIAVFFYSYSVYLFRFSDPRLHSGFQILGSATLFEAHVL